jgi:hypothetical protein
MIGRMTIRNEAETNTARMSHTIDNHIISVMSGTMILVVNQLRAVLSSSEPTCTAHFLGSHVQSTPLLNHQVSSFSRFTQSPPFFEKAVRGGA